MPAIGRRVTRRDGPAKLTGLACYVDDETPPGCLFGVTLRSTIPRGVVHALTLDPGYPWKDVVVVTARDVPHNRVALIADDQPLLADGRVMHQMEPIALVAHRERDKAYEALGHITVVYGPERPVLTVDEALAATTPVHGRDNVFKDIRIERGDVERGFAEADVIVEGEYHLPHQEHAYIETNGMTAWIDSDGTLVVTGSMQCPYYVQKALMGVFALDADRVRVIQHTTGGGFGGKEEYPNVIAGHAALLARAAGRPVKMIYDRHEDMLATTKRHPARIRHRTAVRRDGTLVAQDIDIVMDGGAYMTLSPVVLSRGALHATGPYECPHVRLRARAVATNTPPNGAFRGFGAPQTLFAAELHMDRIASALGLDAVTVRRRNLVRKGSVLATGQVLRESIGARAVLDACVRRCDYRKARRAVDRFNRDPAQRVWKGLGFAVVHHGSGFTGNGEVMLASRAAVTLGHDGSITVLAASTEIGQGTTTMLAQIAADAFGVPLNWVEVEVPDTSKVPNSGPTVASRTCMVVGGLVQRAARRLRRRMIAVTGHVPGTRGAFARAARQVCGGQPSVRVDEEYQKPPEVSWDEDAYRGDAYAVYSYAAAAVELDVDKETYEVTVRKVTTAQDVGKAINPGLVEGQIIGGMVQGLGYALLEHVIYRDGVMANAGLTNYVIPTSLDVPPFDVVLVERPYSRGPSGAKGVGELPMDVLPPAVAAAVFQATGALIPSLPILPESIGGANQARSRVHRQSPAPAA